MSFEHTYNIFNKNSRLLCCGCDLSHLKEILSEQEYKKACELKIDESMRVDSLKVDRQGIHPWTGEYYTIEHKLFAEG
ncbi:MAG: hypothetical protein WC413_04055 [Candidatus Nanoarchaeia archaeon]